MENQIIEITLEPLASRSEWHLAQCGLCTESFTEPKESWDMCLVMDKNLEAPNEFWEVLVPQAHLSAVENVLQRFVGVERRWVISILLYVNRGHWQPQFKRLKLVKEEGDVYNAHNLAEILMPVFCLEIIRPLI